MELLETQDPEKRKLIETSARHKQELQREVGEMAARTEKILTNALIIGGSLALTYFAVSKFSGRSKKRKSKTKRKPNPVAVEEEVEEEEEHEEASQGSAFAPAVVAMIGTRVINQATMILLELAKDKLFEYLHSRKETNENP